MLRPFSMKAYAILLGLRYRLLWAQTRSRNGKIALFVVGYLLALAIMLLMGLGGFSAAMASIRLGKADAVARVVLGAFYVNALLTAVILGFGMNPAFSDAALRRFPVSAFQRVVARQLTSLLEPVWLFFLALDLGLAFGFWVVGVGYLWLSIIAAFLLLITNYLLARVILSLIERIMGTPAGPFIMFLVIACLGLLPALIGPMLAHNDAFLRGAVRVLTFTPPFAAGALMTGFTAANAAVQVLLLIVWIAVLLGIIIVMERHPQATRTVAKAAATWDSTYDRIAASFGPDYGPLIGKTLRYYLRNNRVRYNLVLALPILAILIYTQSRRAGPTGIFIWAVFGFAELAFLGTAAIAVNQFGFDGGGFRRYFLMPRPPETVLRASSFATMMLGAALIPIGLILWFAFVRIPTDARMFSMLLSSAIGGLLLFNALGLWTSLLSPRRVSFSSNFGNQLSLGGNILVIGGIAGLMAGAAVVSQQMTDLVIPFWWVLPVFMLVSAVFYIVTLRLASRVFVARREQLLAVIEGKG